jgi:phage I-like protein
MAGENTATFPIALNAEAGVPSEIMLLPAGPVLTTNDGRGPYKVPNPTKLAEYSLAAGGGKLLIDENHSTDLAMPRGEPAPARGWVTSIHARADGLWGEVQWTEAGRQLVSDKAYSSISPVILYDANGVITRIKRATLINVPNLRGMAALQAQQGDDMLKALLAALGLKDDADEATALNAVNALKSSTALQAALKPIAKAAGLQESADATAICAAVTTLAAGNKDGGTIAALQAELQTVATQFNTLNTSIATERATAFVDGAIKAGRVSVKPMRDHYIKRYALNAAEAAAVEKEIGAMPVLGPSGTQMVPPKDKDGAVALNAEDLSLARQLGIKPENFKKTLAAEAAAQEEAA